MKSKLLYLLSLLLTMPFNYSIAQSQIGSDINGEVADDLSGSSTSISADGSIVAIGAPENDGNGSNSGHVKVYQNVADTWTQIGNDIDGEAADDLSGSSISLSTDGSIVAIGAPENDGNGSNSGHVRVYQNVAGTWTQIGNDIDGEAADDLSGSSISLSADGSIVAIGAPENDGNTGGDNKTGHVRVYQNVAGTWTQIGDDINGEGLFDESGTSVSLSSDGSIIAIGAITNNQGNPIFRGHVRIYQNIASVWTQIGDDIEGETMFELTGISVSLSSDGSILATGAPRIRSSGSIIGSGRVRIFENIAGVWTQIGNNIDGESDNDEFGRSVSISSDGSVITIGGTRNGNNGADSGHVRTYENISGVWTQIGNDIDGNAPEDFFGSSVSLSSDGSIVAIGGTSGSVRIYDVNAVLSTEKFNENYFSSYPNPVKDILNINLNIGIELNTINIYNTVGKFITSSKNLTIDVKKLTRGVYFIEVLTNKGRALKKIVIE